MEKELKFELCPPSAVAREKIVLFFKTEFKPQNHWE